MTNTSRYQPAQDAADATLTLVRTVLSLFDEGHTIKEIAIMLDEKYWKVYDAYRRGVEFLREKLDE